MTVGMIGTVIGFILMLSTSLGNLDPSDVESMRSAISAMAVGMSTALLTTLAGLTATLMLRVQLVMTDAPKDAGAIGDNEK
jgi:biopolymer transport protein ExbB/TolQ